MSSSDVPRPARVNGEVTAAVAALGVRATRVGIGAAAVGLIGADGITKGPRPRGGRRDALGVV